MIHLEMFYCLGPVTAAGSLITFKMEKALS